MEYKNGKLIQAIDAYKTGVLDQQQYYNQLDLIYRANPTSFTEEEVDFLEKQFKKVDLPFNRDLEAADSNLISTVNQFVSGMVEGFTTLGWAEDPDTTAESIANKVGHLIGFAPDVVASVLSMGQYVPIATAKAISRKGAGTVTKGLQAAGQKAPPMLRKEIGTDTFVLQSIPMKVADVVMDNVKASLGRANVDTTGFLAKGIFRNPRFRDIGEQSMHLGVAMAVSSWKDGPKAMADTAVHGAMAGALFGTIGNYVNVARVLGNPKTTKAGQQIIRGVAQKAYDTDTQLTGINMAIKGTLGAGFQGGMATAQGLPVPEQIYEYLLGGFFGATARDRGFVDRTRYINKNTQKFGDPTKPVEQVLKDLAQDPEFETLSSYDKQYVKNHINVVQQQIFNRLNSLEGEAITIIRQIAKENKIDLPNASKEQFEAIKKEYQERKVSEVFDNTTITMKDDVVESTREVDKIRKEIINDLGLDIDSYIRIQDNKDLNEPLAINNDVRAMADIMRGYKIGRNTKDNTGALLELSTLIEKSNYDLPTFRKEFVKRYKDILDDPIKVINEMDVNRLGSYLKIRKNLQDRPELLVDMSSSQVKVVEAPKVSLEGLPINANRSENKYNNIFRNPDGKRTRLILRKSYVLEKYHTFGIKGGKQQPVYKVESPLGFETKPMSKAEQQKIKRKQFEDYLTKEALTTIKKELYKKDAYIFSGAKDSGMVLVHAFPFKNTDITSSQQQQVLNTLGLFKGQKLSESQLKEYTSNIYYLLAESGYINTNTVPTVNTLVTGMKDYINQPLYETVQKFNKYQNLSQSPDVKLEAEDYVNHLQNNKRPELVTDGTFNFITMKDLQSSFTVKGEPSVSATDAVVYARSDTFNTIQTKNYRQAKNGFLKLVGYKAPAEGVGNILLKTGTFKATKAMDKFMFENNIHFIASESAAKTQVGLKLHNIAYDLISKTWGFGSSDKVIQKFKMKPEELYLNYGVYENVMKLNKPALISKQMFDKINYEQLGTDGQAFKDAYNKMVQDSLGGKEADNILFKEAMTKDDSNFDIRDLNSVDLTLINEAISNEGLRTKFGKTVLKKILERGQEDYHTLIQEQGDRIDAERFGIETMDVPDVLAKLDYDISAITYPPLLSWINKSLSNYRQMRLVKPTVEHGFDAKLGPADLEVANNLRDNEIKFGETIRQKTINVKDVGEMTMEQAWNTFEPMKKNPTQHPLYNNYKEALTFLIMRNPNSGNGGVRVVEFVGFSGRDGQHAVTTSKTDYYLGGADKDADAVIVYQNMPEIFKKVFNKYESELFIGGETRSFEQPEGTWKDSKLVEPYDTTNTKKVSLKNKKALEDLIETDTRISVARNAKIGKVNIDYIVSSFNKMQVVADIIEQNGGSLEGTYTTKVKTKNKKGKTIYKTVTKDVTIELKDAVKKLQLDNYIGVNLMADSSNFIKIEKYNVIQDTFWKKYFNVKGAKVEQFSDAFKKIDSLATIKDLHSLVYLGKGQAKYDLVNKIADSYLEIHGDANHFYSNLALGMKEFPNFTINPFKYMFEKDFQGFNSIEVAEQYTLLLREKLINSKMLKRFGIADNYRNELEARATLKNYVKNDNFDGLYQKMIEYNGVYISSQISAQLARDVARLTETRYSNEAIEPVIQDMIDTAYKIKRLYNRDETISVTGKEKNEMSVADINNFIATYKFKLKTKFKSEPDLYKKLEDVFESWLQSTPIIGKDPTKLQQKIINDIESQNAEMVIKEQSKGFNVNSGVYQKALEIKSKAINSIQPYTPFMIKSVAINPKNREMFFKRMQTVLNQNTRIIADRLLGDRDIELDKFINDHMIGDDRTFNIKTIRNAVENDSLTKDVMTVEGDNVVYNYRGLDKAKKNKTIPKDTPSTLDRVLNAEELVGKLLPQFDYLSNQQNTRNKVITTEAQKELKRLREIITKSPDSINRFEELFIDMTYRLEGVGRRLDTLTVQDLKSFNSGLEILYSPKSAKEKLNEFERGPDWKDNTFNYQVVGKELARTEQLTEEFTRPVLDKFGKMKVMRIEVPTSTLELGRQTIDRFDTFQKVMNPAMQNKIDGTFEYLDANSATLIKYRDLLFEAAVNKLEWNDGKYPTGSYDKVEKTYIKDSWKDSERAIKELTSAGETLPLSTKTGEGIKRRVKPMEFVDKIVKDIETLTKDIDKNFIKSRHKQLAQTLVVNYKLPGLFIRKDGDVVGKWKLSRTKDISTKNLEQLFLQDSGIIDTNKISILYKDMSNRNIAEREYIAKYLPSINDYRFFKYHLQVKDRVQFLLPKIDLNKKLNPTQKKLVQQAVLKEIYGKTGKKTDYFAKYQVGDIMQGYFPRNGHGSYKAQRPELEKWQAKKIENDLQAAKDDPKRLPFELQVALKFKRINMATALSTYREHLNTLFKRRENSSLTAGQAEAERQMIDIMSRPNVDGFIGDYATGSTKSRGEEFMPLYKKDLDALRYYANGLFKMYFTNLAGLRSEILLKDFDYSNKGKEYARDWSNYMRNAFTNMMGLSTYRAYNIHGIKKADQPLFKEYIDKGLDISAMKTKGSYQRDLIRDFDIAIDVKPNEQLLILSKNRGNIKLAEKAIQDLKMKRALDLVEQVNTTGKYGSLYHYTSDEVAVGLFSKMNTLFGGKLFGRLPENRRDRQFEIMSRIRHLSDLEGKFELLSLLSHPKTAITNLYGGMQNTISDTGWSSFRKANDPAWMIKNIFDNGRAEFSFVNEATGKVEVKKINSKERIYEWLESLGVYDQMFLDLISLDKNFGKQGIRKFVEEATRRMNRSYARGEITTKEMHTKTEQRTLTEVARDLKIDIPITEFGALPMKWSERKLRGTAFLANYINMHQNVLGPKISDGIPFNSTVLTDFAMKGVTASQFMYQATFRPNFANTSLGRVLTRFQPYAWNSIGRRMRLFKDAQQAQWNADVQASKKFQRQFTFDVMALAMANIFVASIFEYALSPPMNWLQDTSGLLFGDAKERERAFFSSYPHPVLAPLQIVTPPIGRFVLSPITAVLNGDFDKFTKYQLATYFPFGRLYRDAKRTYESPAMAVDFMTGLPLHQIHTLRRGQVEEQEMLEAEDLADELTLEE